MSAGHQGNILKGAGATVTYGTTCDGHEIELDFDRRRIVLNEATLRIDGAAVASERIFYGERQLSASAPDGTEITVSVDSGMGGELTRAQLKRADGSWVDLTER